MKNHLKDLKKIYFYVSSSFLKIKLKNIKFPLPSNSNQKNLIQNMQIKNIKDIIFIIHPKRSKNKLNQKSLLQSTTYTFHLKNKLSLSYSVLPTRNTILFNQITK